MKRKPELYWKCAVNAEGLLVVIDPEAKPHLRHALFTEDEARAIELQDSRAVVVTIERAYVTSEELAGLTVCHDASV